MADPTDDGPARDLRRGVVLRAGEERCEVVVQGRASVLGYAAFFPAPRAGRVSPGHLVAVTVAPDGAGLVVWRWFDAVVLAEKGGLVRLWEPGHGELLARPRRAQRWLPGTRAHASAGLPGADWWAAGPVTAPVEDAEVDLAEVQLPHRPAALGRPHLSRALGAGAAAHRQPPAPQ